MQPNYIQLKAKKLKKCISCANINSFSSFRRKGKNKADDCYYYSSI